METNSLPLVLITHTLPESWLTSLANHCEIITGPEDATELAPQLEENLYHAQGIISLLTIPINQTLLQRTPILRVVSNMAAGVDNIDLNACNKRRIPVGNTPGVLTEGTADLTMALLLSAARGLPQAIRDARQGRWKTWSPTGWLGKDLDGATLGIVGMGKIGSAVAQRAVGFKMRIIYSDPVEHSNPQYIRLSLEELLRQSDFISLHLPLLPKTRRLINIERIKLMKSSAILINTARGPIVDMQALCQALENNMIAGAALDVTDPEPLPSNHPLYRFPNCIILPHIGSATWNTRRRMAELACENLLAGLRGEILPFCVNPEVYI